MDSAQIAVIYVAVGLVACIAVAYRPSRVKDFIGHDYMAQLFAFAFMMLLWPVWFVIILAKGWRHRHPKKVKLA